jgi:hypothetical protein
MFRDSISSGYRSLLIRKLNRINYTGKNLQARQEDAIKCVETFIPKLTATDLRYLLDYITTEAKEPHRLSYLREISVPPGAGSNWYMDCAYAYRSIIYKLENAYDQERTNNAEQINPFKP